MVKKRKHYLTLAVLPKDTYEWKIIQVEYTDYLSPRDWLCNYWEEYDDYERIVMLNDDYMDVPELITELKEVLENKKID